MVELHTQGYSGAVGTRIQNGAVPTVPELPVPELPLFGFLAGIMFLLIWPRGSAGGTSEV